jgi:NTP pyrophosphatase (non-canonical NTP hydrolase)
MVAEFHAHPNCASEDPALRLARHHEEHEELEERLGFEHVDRAKLARELADVTYVCYGTALVHGIDLNAAVREVHRAATGKRDATVRREDGKLIRPPGFRTPDMAAAIGRGRWYLCGNCGTISPDDWEAFKRDDDGLLLPAGPSDYGPGDPLPGLPV